MTQTKKRSGREAAADSRPPEEGEKAREPRIVFALDLGVQHPNDRMFFDTTAQVAEALEWLRRVGREKPVTIEISAILPE